MFDLPPKSEEQRHCEQSTAGGKNSLRAAKTFSSDDSSNGAASDENSKTSHQDANLDIEFIRGKRGLNAQDVMFIQVAAEDEEQHREYVRSHCNLPA